MSGRAIPETVPTPGVCRYGRIDTSYGPAWLGVSGRGVCRLTFGETPPVHVPGGEPDAGFAEVAARVVAAVEAPQQPHAIPLDLHGTPFQRSVWTMLQQIPAGQVRSYGELAKSLGRPGAARAVGAANGANPVAVLVPCHRAVAADGSLHGYAWGLEMKGELLGREGALPDCVSPQLPL